MAMMKHFPAGLAAISFFCAAAACAQTAQSPVPATRAQAGPVTPAQPGALPAQPASAATPAADVTATPPPAAPLAPLVPASPMPAATDPANLWLLDLSDGGRVTIWLRPDMAPTMVNRVKTLTRQHFYDGLAFHRVIEGFMAQGGDPKGDGTGGSTLPNVPAEYNSLPHVRGAVAAARAEDKNSANSQFFIVFQPTLKLDRKYTVFGRVLQGMAYVDAIQRGEPPANPTRITHAYLASDNPPAFVPAPAGTGAGATLPGVTSTGPGSGVGGTTVSATPAAVKPAAGQATARRSPRKR